MAILAAPAAAQQGVYSWTWSEVTTATGQPSTLSPGVVEPGESVRLSLNLNLSPGIGQVFNTVPGGELIVAGWLSSAFGVRALGGFDGVVTAPSLLPGWSLEPLVGSPLPPGAPMLLNQAFILATYGVQPVVPPVPTPDPNPVISFVWTPATYTPRQVSFFNNIDFAAQVYNSWWLYDTSVGQLIATAATSNNQGPTPPSTGPIPLIPAPATLPALAALALLAARRRRG